MLRRRRAVEWDADARSHAGGSAEDVRPMNACMLVYHAGYTLQ
jgi:hypothetical protein